MDQMKYWAPQKKLGGGWICFKDTPAPPAPPDYAGAAQATAAGNLEAARSAAAANRVNQVTPYGSLTYKQDGVGFDQQGYQAAMQHYQDSLDQYNAAYAQNIANNDPYGAGQLHAPSAPDRNLFILGNPDSGWTATQTLSPVQQQLLDQQNQTSLGLSSLAGQGLGYVKDALAHNITAADLPRNQVDPGQTGQDALMARFQPMINESHQALDNKLANQGIMQGSEAYNNAMRTQNQSENDLRSQAALNGINVGQNAQNQQLQLLTALQNQPLNMLNAVRTGSQVTNPSFVNNAQQATTSGADLLGAASQQGQANLGLYNSQVASSNNNNSTTTGLVTAAATIAAMM